MAKQIQSYFKDNDNFINKINNFPVPENSLLVTVDVKSLYMSTPSKKELAVIERK